MRRRFHKTDLLWLGGVLILLAFQFRFPNWGSALGNDTWSVTPDGKKAFYLLASQENPSTARNTKPLAPYLRSLNRSYYSEWTLCLLGPSRVPSAEEREAILEWVRNGGHLLYAAGSAADEFEIPELGIKTILRAGEEKAEFAKPESTELKLGDISANLSEDDYAYDWHSGREVSGKAAVPILLLDDSIQASRQTYGRGLVTVIASDDIFTNRSLLYGDNEILAWRLLEAAQAEDGQLIFDEYLNTSGTPKMLAILFDHTFRPATLQILLVVCLFCWYASHRFGPFAEASSVSRRNIVDHTDMVGILMFKRQNGAYALRVYLKQLIAELKLKQNKGRERRILDPIAVRMGLSGDDLMELFREAAQAVRSKTVDRQTSARLIHRLSEIRAAALPGKKSL